MQYIVKYKPFFPVVHQLVVDRCVSDIVSMKASVVVRSSCAKRVVAPFSLARLTSHAGLNEPYKRRMPDWLSPFGPLFGFL